MEETLTARASRLAYLDLASGASGDMLLAACADAGRRAGLGAAEAIAEAVASLGLGCSVTFSDTRRGAVACLQALVETDGVGHDPDELREAIAGAEASDEARALAGDGLEALVGAEARVHGTSTEEVHLHELGSADTAADLIGVAVGLEALGTTSLAAAPVPVPRGWISTDHGALPLPAPAVLELLRGTPVHGVEAEVELVTPTAAAILVSHRASFGPLPTMRLEAVGTGAGARDLEHPNVCRLFLGTPAPGPDTSGAPASPDVELVRDVLLETNVDDQTPEGVGRALERLMEAGAKDAWVTPIVMKKSRPAFGLSVLCDPSDEARLLELLFRETTTLGVRRRELGKWALRREEVRVEVRGSTIRVKVARLGREVLTVSPEYADCAKVADRDGVAFRNVYAEAMEEARAALDPNSS